MSRVSAQISFSLLFSMYAIQEERAGVVNLGGQPISRHVDPALLDLSEAIISRHRELIGNNVRSVLHFGTQFVGELAEH